MIDGMLTVDVDKRLTLEDCMNHPWMHGHSAGSISHSNGKMFNPNDSTGGLVGGIADLDFQKRRVERERTLLSSINEVMLAKKIEMPKDGKDEPVNVYIKNPNQDRLINKGAKDKENGNGVAKEKIGKREAKPDAERQVREFERMGGKGDRVLFEDDPKSIYPGKDVGRVKK